MPEGDTVWRTAKHLNDALAGYGLISTDFRVPQYATLDLHDAIVDNVVARGKHIMLHATATDGDQWTIHSHLKMEGAWHIYRPTTRWRRPRFQARAILSTSRCVAVGFELGALDVVRTDEEGQFVDHLGPDLLGPDWNATRAIKNLRAHPSEPIFIALEDQRNLAGLGNEYVNELCFVLGVLPTTPVRSVDLERAVEHSRKMLLANRDRVERTTTGLNRSGQRDWVFGRGGLPCRRCGMPIRKGSLGPTPTTRRNTFWCPSCQR